MSGVGVTARRSSCQLSLETGMRRICRRPAACLLLGSSTAGQLTGSEIDVTGKVARCFRYSDRAALKLWKHRFHAGSAFTSARMSRMCGGSGAPCKISTSIARVYPEHCCAGCIALSCNVRGHQSQLHPLSSPPGTERAFKSYVSNLEL